MTELLDAGNAVGCRNVYFQRLFSCFWHQKNPPDPGLH